MERQDLAWEVGEDVVEKVVYSPGLEGWAGYKTEEEGKHSVTGSAVGETLGIQHFWLE